MDHFSGGRPLIGPIIYTVTKGYGDFKIVPEIEGQHADDLTFKFPYSGLFAIIALISCVMCGIGFSLIRTGILDGNPDLAINTTAVNVLSWVIFVMAILLFFCVTSYRNSLEIKSKSNPEVIVDMPRDQLNELATEWKNRADA